MPSFSLRDALSCRILPAIHFKELEDVMPVAEAAVRSGQRVIEIPFRSDVAHEAIRMIRTSFPQIMIGAGTILSTEQLELAIDAGAQFALAPAFNPEVCRAAIAKRLPFVPGVFSPSEIESAQKLGLSVQKIFPAAQAGGPAYFRAIDGPYGRLDIKFIPMGGVNIANLAEYLSLKNVIAVGGTWLASGALLGSKNYRQIEKNFSEALNLANKR